MRTMAGGPPGRQNIDVRLAILCWCARGASCGLFDPQGFGGLGMKTCGLPTLYTSAALVASCHVNCSRGRWRACAAAGTSAAIAKGLGPIKGIHLSFGAVT